MAYFSNGSEGDEYQHRWCERCVHDDPDKGCTVWLLHLLFNYSECNNKDSMLHKLIPRKENGFAGECKMFIERKDGKS